MHTPNSGWSMAKNSKKQSLFCYICTLWNSMIYSDTNSMIKSVKIRIKSCSLFQIMQRLNLINNLIKGKGIIQPSQTLVFMKRNLMIFWRVFVRKLKSRVICNGNHLRKSSRSAIKLKNCHNLNIFAAPTNSMKLTVCIVWC